MPWTKDKPPDAIKDLPAHAQEIWIAAGNSALKQYGDESRAIATAWAAVKKAGYAKGEDGKWHKVHIDREHVEAFTEQEIKQSGKHWGPTLMHIGLCGADMPAVKTLADVKALGDNDAIDEIEIFEVGDHKGDHYDERFLDRVVDTFKTVGSLVKPKMILVHDPKHPLVANEGLPSLGRAVDVWRKGSKLVASLTQVPGIIKELITSGRYDRISCAFDPDFVFSESGGRTLTWIDAQADQTKEGSDMADKTFTQEDLDRKVKDAVADAVKAKEKEFTEAKGKLEKDIETKDAAIKAQQEAERKGKIDTFIEKFTEKGVAPVVLDAAKEVLEQIDSEKALTFSDKTEEPLLDRALTFVESVLAAAEASMIGEGDKKLFVPQGEVSEGKEFTAPGKGGEAADKKESEALAALVNPPKKD